MQKITIDKYLDGLAARMPVPGGGSAAALVGAIGMALLSMVARYMVKKNNREATYKKLSRILQFTESSRRRLRKLMNEDEAAYLRLSKGIRGRDANIIRLYKSAAEAPLEVCAILQEGLKRCEQLYSHCKTSLASDLAAAALLLEAGFLSAKANIDINLAGITDKMYTKNVRSSLLKQKIFVQKAKKRIMKKWRQL